jgi:hypothetical protein
MKYLLGLIMTITFFSCKKNGSRSSEENSTRIDTPTNHEEIKKLVGDENVVPSFGRNYYFYGWSGGMQVGETMFRFDCPSSRQDEYLEKFKIWSETGYGNSDFNINDKPPFVINQPEPVPPTWWQLSEDKIIKQLWFYHTTVSITKGDRENEVIIYVYLSN